MYITALLVVFTVMSPGPDFILTCRHALLAGRRSGVLAALGISAGVLVHVAYSVVGIGIILSEHQFALTALRLAGGAYLIWLGARLLFQSFSREYTKSDADPTKPLTSNSEFVDGFLCNALNPKTALFFVALFANTLSQGVTIAIQVIIGLSIAALHFFWFAFVAFLMSTRRLSNFMENAGGWIDRLSGSCLIVLGSLFLSTL